MRHTVPSQTASVFGNLDGEIHVWTTRLDVSREALEHYREMLDGGERERIERYKTPELRARHTTATGVLRSLLGRYTGQAPERVEMDHRDFHKPSLLNHENGLDLHFSMSHSTRYAAYAFTGDGPIGIDLEEIVDVPNWQDTIDVVFSDYEKRWFSLLLPNHQQETFLRIWTIKEAYLKAIGTGHSVPPTGVELEFTEADCCIFRRLPDERDSLKDWRIFSLSPVPGFLAAVVVKAGSRQLRCFSWEPHHQELGAR